MVEKILRRITFHNLWKWCEIHISVSISNILLKHTHTHTHHLEMTNFSRVPLCSSPQAGSWGHRPPHTWVGTQEAGEVAHNGPMSHKGPNLKAAQLSLLLQCHCQIFHRCVGRPVLSYFMHFRLVFSAVLRLINQRGQVDINSLWNQETFAIRKMGSKW